MYRKSLKLKVLNEAFDSFLDIINEYASKHNLSHEEKNHLIKLAEDAYMDKKIEYYLEDKLASYSSFLNFSVNFALNKNSGETEKSYWNILYVKQLEEFISNE